MGGQSSLGPDRSALQVDVYRNTEIRAEKGGETDEAEEEKRRHTFRLRQRATHPDRRDNNVTTLLFATNRTLSLEQNPLSRKSSESLKELPSASDISWQILTSGDFSVDLVPAMNFLPLTTKVMSFLVPSAAGKPSADSFLRDMI